MKRAITTFAIGDTVVSEGTEFDDQDAIVVGREELFVDTDPSAALAVVVTPPANEENDEQSSQTAEAREFPADEASKAVWETFADSYDPPLPVDKKQKKLDYVDAVKAAALAAVVVTPPEA